MSRIIINNESRMSDIEAMLFVISHMQGGRVSNDGKQYCYVVASDDYISYARLNKKSDSFLVMDSNKTQWVVIYTNLKM